MICLKVVNDVNARTLRQITPSQQKGFGNVEYDPTELEAPYQRLSNKNMDKSFTVWGNLKIDLRH